MSSQNEGVPPPAATGARTSRVTLPVKNPYTGEVDYQITPVPPPAPP